MKAFDLYTASLDEVRRFVNSDNGDRLIANFVNDVRAEAGSIEGYKALCDAAEIDLVEGKLPEKVFETISQDFLGYIVSGPAGHGVSHLIRDTFVASAMASDSNWSKIAYSMADVWAGVIAGILHDIGNAVTQRYADYKRRNGHAEIAAWITYGLLEGALSREMRLMIAYAIIAHTHYRKPIEIKLPSGTFMRPEYEYWDINPERDDNIGLAIIMARAIDRSGTRGLFHLTRHIMAEADVVEKGEMDAVNLAAADHLYGISLTSLEVALMPKEDVVERDGGKYATVLKHMVNYSGQDLGGGSPYGNNDPYLGSNFIAIMTRRMLQLNKVRAIFRQEIEVPEDFSRVSALIALRQMFSTYVRAGNFNQTWAVVYQVLAGMSDADLLAWEKVAAYAVKEYAESTEFVLSLIDPESPVIPLITDLMAFAV